MSWEDKFQSWSQPPSQTEQNKCANAERAIKRAISGDKILSRFNIRVFAQGSYCARTNIRLDSDVDINVCLQQPFFCHYPPGKTQSDFGLTDGAITFPEYRQLVENALVNEFGRKSVRRGKKAFDVHENTYRIDADVVASLAHRHYTGQINRDGTYQYILPTGVEFHPDDGGSVINWPDQTYTNGIEKNDNTGRRFKGIVRILKRLRNEMQDAKIKEANDIASFLIESLVLNAPKEAFGHEKLSDDVRYVLAYCFNQTLDDQKCKGLIEVNAIKYLFASTQPWTRQQSHDFLFAAWNYIGFK